MTSSKIHRIKIESVIKRSFYWHLGFYPVKLRNLKRILFALALIIKCHCLKTLAFELLKLKNQQEKNIQTQI